MKIEFIKKTFFLSFLILLYSNCSSIEKINTSPSNTKEIESNVKRIVVVGGVENGTPEESRLLREIARDQVSHHREFIVYRLNEKDKNPCLAPKTKVQGLLKLSLIQTVKRDKVSLVLKSTITSCKNESLPLWEAAAKDTISSNPGENLSLQKSYTDKFGESVKMKVNPYYLLIKEVVEEMPRPKLTDEEETEKIEVESE